MAAYNIGDIIRVSTEFKDPADVLVDPGEVRVKVRDPKRIITTYTYPTDTQIVKDAVGKYHFDLAALKTGTYCVRWEGRISNIGAEEIDIEVDDSCFYKKTGEELP
jgi:hypothetical protein